MKISKWKWFKLKRDFNKHMQDKHKLPLEFLDWLKKCPVNFSEKYNVVHGVDEGTFHFKFWRSDENKNR